MKIVASPDRFPSPSGRGMRAGSLGSRRCRDSVGGYNRASGSTPKNDTDFLWGQASLARTISEPSSQAANIADEPTNNGTKGIELSQNSGNAKNKLVHSGIANNESHAVGSPSTTRLLAKNGTVIQLKRPVKSSDLGVSSSIEGYNFASDFRDKGKGVVICGDSHPRTEQATPGPLQLDDSPRKTERRRLVRNGCISRSVIPNQIAEHKYTAAKGDGVVDMEVDKLPGRISSNPIHIVSPDSDDRFARAKFRPGRLSLAPGKGVTGQMFADGNNMIYKDRDQRTLHNPSDKSHEIATRHNVSLNIEVDSPELTAFHHVSSPNPVRITSERVSENKRISSKGKRKCSQIGECSSSSLDDSQTSHRPSSGQSSNSDSNPRRKSQRRGVRLGPIAEVDELCSSYTIRNNPRGQTSVLDESNASVRQVESDEMLARQLQEQLYNETPVSRDTEEIDASLARSLQQEEDARRSSISRQGRNERRGRPTSSSRLRNSTARPTVRARLPAVALSMERLRYLEAVEAVLENHANANVSTRIHQVHRDFNEDDYEMLLALDENNENGGASESQISRLPESVVETGSVQEACAVCLEPPVAGDTIRHMPCLHKFHKECIDAWLRRKKLCPICKSGIS